MIDRTETGTRIRGSFTTFHHLHRDDMNIEIANQALLSDAALPDEVK